MEDRLTIPSGLIPGNEERKSIARLRLTALKDGGVLSLP